MTVQLSSAEHEEYGDCRISVGGKASRYVETVMWFRYFDTQGRKRGSSSETETLKVGIQREGTKMI
jgi:hypothetical protein